MSDHTKDHPTFRPKDFFNPRSYYWQTRQWQYLKQGMPAIVVSLLILVPVFSYPLLRKGSVERYRVAFSRAVQREQFDTANLLLQKLDSLPDESEEGNQLSFNRALVSLGRGHTEEGIAAMQKLAPDDSFGYGPAHGWLAQKHLTEDPTISGDNAETVVHHLESALRANKENEPLRVALAHYYYRTDKPANAIRHLTAVVKNQPELHFVLANLHKAIGNDDFADEHFELAVKTLALRLKTNPDEIETRVNLAIAQRQLGNFQESIKTLGDGIDPAKPNQLLRNTLSKFYLAESDRLREDRNPSDAEFEESLVMLSNSLQAAPNNDGAVNRIAALASLDGSAGEKAVEVLKKLLAQGKMTATAHVILGTAFLEKKDYERAKRHYAQAYALDPKMPALLNNIAWVLSHEDPPQSERALAIINSAIENANLNNPILPYMLDTRGQIYVQMQRWEDALIDLERALTDMPDNPDVHKALAIAYRNLGEPELANEHEKLARKPDVNK